MKVFKIATIKPIVQKGESMKKLLFAVLFAFFSCGAWAQERITQFASNVRVDNQGTALVQEEISVVAQHQNIRRGIYRDLPNSSKVTVEVLSLEMDGAPHPFFIEKHKDFLRVNFGNDHFIPRGPHTYRLTYMMKNVVRFFPEYDEFYWNVTGNNSAFPIDRAVFELDLPQGAQADEGRISSYIGYYGQKGYPAVRENLQFWTPSPLAPRQGLTVAVPWQKGVVEPPALGWWQRNEQNVVFGIVLAVILLLWGFYYVSWRRVGKDPDARVIRLFDPPEGFSAVMTNYVYYMGMSNSSLAVCITSLAVKGALEIKEDTSFVSGTQYTLTLKNKDADMLSLEEKAVLDTIFAHGRTEVQMGMASRFIFKEAQLGLSKCLQQRGGKQYFVFNWKYNLATLAALGVLLLVGGISNPSIAAAMLGVFITAVTYIWANARRKTVLGTLGAVAILFMLGVFVRAVLEETAYPLPVWLGIMLVSISGGFFACWIQSYTKQGRLIMDQIEGFKEYLEIGEGGRVEMSNPAQAAQVFCDYLPYAYALGVQSKWLKAFKKHMDEAVLTQAIHSRGLMLRNVGMLSSVVSGFTAAVNQSSGSSGSGGSGFSGGGFGGGGGGGR